MYHDFSCFQTDFKLVQADTALRIVKGTHIEGSQIAYVDRVVDLSQHVEVHVLRVCTGLCGWSTWTDLTGLGRDVLPSISLVGAFPTGATGWRRGWHGSNLGTHTPSRPEDARNEV